MLTDDDRTPFAGLKVVGEQQDAIGENVLPDIEDNFIPLPAGFVIKEPGPRICRRIGGRTAADDFVPQTGLEILACLRPACERTGIGPFPEELLPPRCRLSQKALRQIYQLHELPLPAGSAIEIADLWFQQRTASLDTGIMDAEIGKQRTQGLPGPRQPVFRNNEVDGIFAVELPIEVASALKLRFHGFDLWRHQLSGCSAGTTGAGRRGTGDLRSTACLDDQRARRDQAGNFGIAEFMQQPPYVPVDRLAPDLLPRLETAAYSRGLNPCIDGGAAERNQSAFSGVPGSVRRIGHTRRESCNPDATAPPVFQENAPPRRQHTCRELPPSGRQDLLPTSRGLFPAVLAQFRLTCELLCSASLPGSVRLRSG